MLRLDSTACAAFIEESHMNFASANQFDRKSGSGRDALTGAGLIKDADCGRERAPDCTALRAVAAPHEARLNVSNML